MAAGFSPQMAQRIELWPVERLVPFENNARVHSAEQLAQIQSSIREFGFTAPILVDGQAGILAGHGRLEAAKALGMAEVPVVVLDHLTPEQRRLYVLADNKLAENAGWDDAKLAAELRDLMAADFDLSAMGFSDEDLRRLEDGLELGQFEELSQGYERAEPEDQPGLGMMPGADEDDGPEDATAESGEVEEPEEEDEGINRGVALAIVLSPQELMTWRRAKAELGYSTDKAAFWKLVTDLLEEAAR